MEHQEWFNQATDSASIHAAARATGIPQRTLARQVERGELSAENVIAIAEAYGLHPVGALVDTGYLEDHWAEQIDPTHAVRAISDEQLCDEFLRRLKLPDTSELLELPVDDLTERRHRQHRTADANNTDDQP